MKKYIFYACMFFALLCSLLAGCSKANAVSALAKEVPEDFTRVEVSGFYNGGKVEPWELTQAEIEELRGWIGQLSLEHRTYAKGKAPNEAWNGGVSYDFTINGGEFSFAWSYIDKVYIFYDGEWYEVMNDLSPPLDLPI